MTVGQTRYMRFGPQRERTNDLKVSVGWDLWKKRTSRRSGWIDQQGWDGGTCGDSD